MPAKKILSGNCNEKLKYEGGNKMREIKKEERAPLLIKQLLDVWEKSVKETHLFISNDEIKNIKKYVPQAINGISHLIIETDDKEDPIAFMGIEDEKLEMLFISPEKRGKGLGKRLLEYGIEKYSVKELAVNEQNPLAKGFYEHMGFYVYKRTDIDEQGNPYPILYMKIN